MRRSGRAARRRSPQILVVCTGNVCRSPYLAGRLQQALPDLQVASAGTGAVVGAPPTPQVAAALRRQGVLDYAGTGRRLTARAVRRAALIVTAERAHRVRVDHLDAAAGRRTFTVKELARVLEADPAHGIADIIARAGAAARAEALAHSDHDDDLADPYGLDDDAYALMFTQADAALRVIVPALRGT